MDGKTTMDGWMDGWMRVCQWICVIVRLGRFT